MMEEGKIAEQEVESFLNWHPAVTEVKNVTDRPDMQSKDVDFLVTLKGLLDTFGKIELPIEAKWDTNMGVTGNIAFELTRFYLDAAVDTPDSAFIRPGWSWFSEAKRFCIWSPFKRNLYMIEDHDLRRALQLCMRHEGKRTRTHIVETDKDTRTLIVTIPERYVRFKLFSKRDLTWQYDRTNEVSKEIAS